MPTLVEKMKANAAERLALPEGRKPAEELARYKNFLKVETHRLKIMHRAGADGLEICSARAMLLDILITNLWDAAFRSLTSQAQREFPPLALVAIGGYGRAELNPCSDIDFMFLHDGRLVAGNRPMPHLARIMDGILYPLWDIGLKVGYAVRSLDDCVRVANTDMQSKTSLIESRLITGHEPLFKKYQRIVKAKCVEGFEETYFEERLVDQAARRKKFGNSALMQEPNLKNGCGGLRDFQNLLWMSFVKYHTRSLADLEKRELISRSEHKQLQTAYDFLLRVRNELHYQTNRAADALLKSLQPAVALHLGYEDRSPSRRIEKFMRDYYTHARNIHLLTTALEQRLALLPPVVPPGRLAKLKKLFKNGRRRAPGKPVELDGFKITDGVIEPLSSRVFRDQPRRLMRVFLHVQQRGLKLHPDLPQMIRNHEQLVDRDFLRDEHVRETFLAILNQRGNVAPTLRAMHEVGLLGKYIPEFGKLTCLVQHEFYHQYAADEHTLVCLEKLDQIAAATQPPFSNYTELFQSLNRPFLLYLALLLHDVGKAEGHGKHSAVGSQLAVRVAKRLKLDDATTQALARLVEYHLLMARISQRHDLDDPTVISNFARHIETQETLAHLTLLTFADSQGTSDKLWTGFKEDLLWSLHRKASVLLSGATEFIEVAEQQREVLAQEVRRLLPKEIAEEELEAHFNALPARYFQIHPAKDVAADIELVHEFLGTTVADEQSGLAPVIRWHNDLDRGGNIVKVCTWDRKELFSKIAGALSATGLNILTAQIFTRNDNVVLDTFFITDARTGTLASREQREKFEKLLTTVLTEVDSNLAEMIMRQKPVAPLYQSPEGEQLDTSITFDNEISDLRTVIEIETEDRVALLYAIVHVFAEMDVNICSAKIFTEKGAALDTFYVSELSGEKILGRQRQQEVEMALRLAVGALAAA